MRVNVREKIIGDTYKTTWVSSGGNPLPITSALIDKTNTCVQSLSAISSGNGFYFALHQLPLAPGYYVNEWRATVGGYTYVNRQLVHVNDPQVD